jgi:hypothetical protein
MNVRAASAALVTLLALPLGVWAQDVGVPEDAQLQMEMKRRRTIVHPLPSRQTVEQDVERSEVVRAERLERIIREVTRPVPRRPDLDYDVTSGIQARNLRELRR